ncbi:hypothetical protein RN001_000439 [Aquatica leii]|uniref:KAT8 regulatory NSL complex subunit 2 n=1 Tax=Aquatica leii TaxID=1421715 RepID=A0AAN7PFB5_9COLE|nr:hypothetical protein RN001_000439 [Aquatica leii]
MADQPRMQVDKLVKNKQTNSTQDSSEKALKSEVEVQIINLKQCAYSVYNCKHYTLDGYDYCLRHILNDKNAPYKQCTYIYNTNGKRCHLPAPKDKKDPGYCNEHALKTNLQNWKRSTHSQPPRTSEVLLHSLSHYIKKPRSRTVSASTQCSDDDHNITEDSDSVITKCLDPFIDIDANGVLSSSSQILDMCSDSESDVDATSFGSIWHDIHAESSDNDSIDSEKEDVLKHAKMYSAEEVTLLARDKLMRLQSLYVDQYRYLQHMLRERRRRYLHALKREKETYCSITNQTHETAKEQRLYKKLKAYNSYHRKHGIEAICSKRLYEKRLKVTEGMTPKAHAYTKCVFTEGGVKCGERALPVTRHCRKHILEDTNQVLFRACSKIQGNVECTTPVEAIFDDTTCRLHMDIPEIRSYSNTRKDSESDYDESLEVPTNLIVPSLKPEINEIKIENVPDENPVLDYDAIKEENMESEEQLAVKEEMDYPDTSIGAMECDTSAVTSDNITNEFDVNAQMEESIIPQPQTSEPTEHNSKVDNESINLNADSESTTLIT